MGIATQGSVRITDPDAQGAYVLTCDHASNFIPEEFGTLGLPESELGRHIAWDPGALAVARGMAKALRATLIETCISRLVLDCNRSLEAPDLVPSISEATSIPGNAQISEQERQTRIDRCWRPFHDTVEAVVEKRLARGQETRLVSIHTFNPVYKGVARQWQIGIIHDEDTRLAQPLINALRAVPGMTVGANEPYSPADRVYYTLERHARSRGLPCAMIEIRNDEVADEAGQRKWAELLSALLDQIRVDDEMPVQS